VKTSHKIALGVGLLQCRFVVYRVRKTPPRWAKRLLNRGDDVDALFSKDAIVAPSILGKLHPRIDLDAISTTVVHLRPSAQNEIYATARALWERDDFPPSKQDLVRTVLSTLAPATRWTFAREQLADDDPRAQVWDGTTWLCKLMGASFEDEQGDVRSPWSNAMMQTQTERSTNVTD
jgi:hypothetical protein